MDILDPALSLEETYYAEGLALGQADGAKAGLVEGRRFGLEKGFEKFAAMGRLHGRSIVWNSRIAPGQITSETANTIVEIATTGEQDHEQRTKFLPQLFHESSPSEDVLDSQMDDMLPPADLGPRSLPLFSDGSSSLSISRVQKHVSTLYALTEPESLSIENDEEAVSEFDDRYRRAVAKYGIIGKLVGEDDVLGPDAGEGVEDGALRRGKDRKGDGEGEVEDIVWNGMQRRSGQPSDAGNVNGSDLEVEIK